MFSAAVHAFISALRLDGDDVLRADVILQLMCQGRIDIAAVEQRYAIEFPTYVAASIERLRPLIGDGLVGIDDREIRATRSCPVPAGVRLVGGCCR